MNILTQKNGRPNTVDGRNRAPPKSNHETPLFVGIYRGVNIPGFLRWCRIASIHSMTYSSRVEIGLRSPLLLRKLGPTIAALARVIPEIWEVKLRSPRTPKVKSHNRSLVHLAGAIGNDRSGCWE